MKSIRPLLIQGKMMGRIVFTIMGMISIRPLPDLADPYEIWRGPNWGHCKVLSADSYNGHKVITLSFLYLIKNKKQQRYKEGVLLDIKRLLFCFR